MSTPFPAIATAAIALLILALGLMWAFGIFG